MEAKKPNRLGEREAVEKLVERWAEHIWGVPSCDLSLEQWETGPDPAPDMVLKRRDGSIVAAVECTAVRSDMTEREKRRRLNSLGDGGLPGECSSDAAVWRWIIAAIREKECKAKNYTWPACRCQRVLLLSLNGGVGMAFGQASEVPGFGWSYVEVEEFDHVFVHDEPTRDIYPLPVRSKRGRT